MSKGEHLGASVTALLCACSPSAHLVLTKEVLTTILPPCTYHHVPTTTYLHVLTSGAAAASGLSGWAWKRSGCTRIATRRKA